MNWNTPQKETFVRAVLALKTPDETRRFLRDLMTKKEIEEFSSRLQVAHMLYEKIPYSVIKKETGLSSTTVARVSKWLQGHGGGYRTVLSRHHRGSGKTNARED